MGHAANFLYMLSGDASEPHRDQGDGHRLDAARRPRAQRVDVCGTRGRGDAHRHPFGDRRRHRHVEGPAARRRQRRSDEDADRDRPGRAGRSHRRATSRASWRGRKRSPASVIASTTPKIRARRTCRKMSKELGQKAGNTKWYEMSERIEAIVKGGEEALSERRLLFGVDVLHDGHSDRSLHADLRGQPHQRLDRARARAVLPTTA